MTRVRRLWIGVVLCVAAAPAGAADLALKRVMLSSGGVGYFEYEAKVEGDATLDLDVALEQVDDVLKSLVVYDSGGTAGEVTLPGRNPLTQGFADLPFDRTALGSAADLLNALQGAEVRLERPEPLNRSPPGSSSLSPAAEPRTDRTEPMTGRLVHVDQEMGPDTRLPARARVTILTASGLQQILLQDVTAISFVDPDLQQKIATALQRIAAYRDTARRRLAVSVHGTGQRTVRLGYVVGVPLWKATYRLSLPSDAAAETARMQGWAVLENMSGRAWQDIELTLLSGNPVTFRQALYESYYVTRPNVPVESGGRVLPPADTGSVATAARSQATVPSPPPPMPAAQAPMMMRKAAPAQEAASVPAGIAAAETTEQATQVAFTLPYNVSAAAGQSLMLPLLDRELPARRVDLYQPSVDRTHPLAAIAMTNNADTSLPPGVLTLYQQAASGNASYIGDARLAAFPAGDKRMLSYAVDNKTVVDRSTADRRFTVKAAIAEGVLRLTQTAQQTTTYRIKAAAPGSLLIEHPRLAGWTLKQPDPAKIEMTSNAYRVPVTLAAGDNTATVVEEKPIEESIGLTDLGDDRLQVLVSSNELDPKLRQVLADVAQRRQAIARQRADLERLTEQRGQLVEDETRLRDNLTAVGNEPALRKRLLDKFNQIETAIDNAAASITQAQAAAASAERDLAAYIAHLNI